MGYLYKVERISGSSAGVYMLVNKINDKKYIGQSINLKKRLKKHFYLSKEKRYDAPIYRAIEKYGIDNFDLSILYGTEDKDYRAVKKILDEKEKYYIDLYKTYGQYNQTKGGDAGILGYKFTESQAESHREKSRKAASDGRYMMYIYDVIDKMYYTFVNSRAAGDVLKEKGISLRGSNRYMSPYKNRYLVSLSKDGLEHKKKQFLSGESKGKIGKTKYHYRININGEDVEFKDAHEFARYFETTSHNIQALTQKILKTDRSKTYKGCPVEIFEYY